MSDIEPEVTETIVEPLVETSVTDETIEHTVTSEDLANNPQLVEEGVKEGEVIGIPTPTEQPTE